MTNSEILKILDKMHKVDQRFIEISNPVGNVHYAIKETLKWVLFISEIE